MPEPRTVTRARFGVVLLALVAGAACRPAQPAGAPSPSPTVRSSGAGATGGRAGESSLRPYAQVVPPSARTRDGLFRTHLFGTKLYFEIPAKELTKDLLLVRQIARAEAGNDGYRLPLNTVVRWERRGQQVLLRSVSYELTADTGQAIYRAVRAANYEPIVAAFDIETYGPDSAAVIEVTRLYTQSPNEFGVGNDVQGSIDVTRSFVERVAAFPDNIEVEATQTFNLARSPNAPQPDAASMLVHWSMVRLPERPMMPRLHDHRVGFFPVTQNDFGREAHGVERRRYITRWRLEKNDTAAALSPPVKPIEYYVDPATPPRWVPYVKRGIEAWQQAFEAAGFKNAIVARDAPSPAEDPDWSPEDARYSVVRWLASTREDAIGPHVHDPRTGEILDADVQLYHNVQKVFTQLYFVQAAPLDPRARTLPLPDTLMGRLIEYVVAHEVGHTLGFPHNMKASSTYPADSLRSVSFLRRMGHTPTLMDYSRFNYVAQPEDSIPPELLVPGVGVYDLFATRWGYAPIPGAKTPEDERPTLSAWAREQDERPWLRFSVAGTAGADPSDHLEAVGDADPVGSTRLGLRNIRRIVPMLIPATEQPGRDYSALAELYDKLVEQWKTELIHVVSIVGGVDAQEKYVGQTGVRFEPVSKARQAEALRFLNEHAFATPDYLLDPEILRRIEVRGTMERLGGAQQLLIRYLLDDARIARLIEFEALADRRSEVYTLGEMLGDLRRGIWRELEGAQVRVDPFRRNLQRGHLAAINEKLFPPPRQQRPAASADSTRATPVLLMTTDARALLRGELRDLDRALHSALARATDRPTRLHLEDARLEIERMLDPSRD